MVWFPGKVALVTGAGSGIGRASALKFAHEGAKVIVSDIVAEGGHETVRLIREAGGEATFVKTDVSQASDVEALVRQAVETYGQLNYAHNNAGLGAGVSRSRNSASGTLIAPSRSISKVSGCA